MHEFTPANVPGLPAGWEIHHDEKYFNLSLWRVVAYLKDWKEDRDDPLNFSCSRFADAYLPEGYTKEDFDEALQELVWKAEYFDEAIDTEEHYYDWIPKGTDRPTRSYYFRKLR